MFPFLDNDRTLAQPLQEVGGYLADRVPRHKADFCGQLRCPATGWLAKGSRTLVQEDSQRFACYLVKLGVHGFGREDSCLRQASPFCSKAWIALRTSWVAQPRLRW